MKIQIASDLHLEFLKNREWIENNPLIPNGNVLLLAGDIVSDKKKKKANDFFKTIDKKFEKVIYTMGNHEFYNGEIDYAYPNYKKNLTDKIIKLNNQSLIIEDIKIIASVLWTNIPNKYATEISEKMNDYKLIYHKNNYDEKYYNSTDYTNNINELSIKFIKNELEKNFEGKIIILSHHVPCFISSTKNALDCAYYNDLENLIIEHNNIFLWAFGHIHKKIDKKIGNARILSNPLGYVDEQEHINFDRSLIIEI